MRVVLLAAGAGSRLRPYTADRPKCLVELAGACLLDHQLAVLGELGLADVSIVTGYRHEQLAAFGLRTFHNPAYDRTNMVTSLMCAAELLDGGDDVIAAYADIVYEPQVLAALLDCDAPLATTIDRDWRRLWSLRHVDPLDDAETLRLDAAGNVLELGGRPGRLEEIEGQYMGLIRIGAPAAPALVALHGELRQAAARQGRDTDNLYMTELLQGWIDSGRSLRAVTVNGGWIEVDSAEDLESYRELERQGRLAEYCRLGGAEPR